MLVSVNYELKVLNSILNSPLFRFLLFVRDRKSTINMQSLLKLLFSVFNSKIVLG